jgi:4-amino-4-deoxy-L-arabinose transferase-like glycosyltransferase
LVSGAAMLIKGVLIFIPPLTLLYLGVQAWHKRVSPTNAVVFAVVCLCTITPWSIFTSSRSGHFIVLSTQAKMVLLEGNNEGTWENGGWNPEYKRNPDAFYNRPEIKELPTLQQVARFYLAYPKQIPTVISQKLTGGFSSFPFLRLAILLILVHLFAILDSMKSRSRPAGTSQVKRPIATYAAVSIILLAVLASIPLMFLILCSAVGYLGFKGHLERFPFPVSFAVVFANFVLVILVTFGEPRFISVIDFLFMLTGITLLIPLLVRIVQGKAKPLSAFNVFPPMTEDRNQ